MNKIEILSSLHAARLAHVKWVIAGRQLLDGVDFNDVQKPTKCTECTFGQWFYAHRENIQNISGFKTIEELHIEFHQIYETIYINAPRVHKSKGIFSNKKLQTAQKEFLANDYKKLENISKKLIIRLSKVEEIVSAMSDRLFERNKTVSK
jgi:hypothetical protein